MHTKTTTLVGAVALGIALQASAGTTTTAIVGSQSAQENGCIDAIGLFTSNDCSYNGINRWTRLFGNPNPVVYDPPLDTLTQDDVTPPLPIEADRDDDPNRVWIGPLANQMYYERGDSPLTQEFPDIFPAVGDNKARLGLSGQITIDDSETPADGYDDLISGEIVIAAGTRNVLTGQDDTSRVEESWSSLTQTLDPTAVDSATPNAMGGFDYVIASRGMPDRLQPDGGKNNQPYPSEIASSPIETPIAVSGWVAPDSQGRSVANFECVPERPTTVLAFWHRSGNVRAGSVLNAPCADPSSNNVGATTTGVFTDHSCLRFNGNPTCPTNPAVLGAPMAPPNPFIPPLPAGDPGYQNLLIALSTDADGYIVSADAFYTHQYQVLQNFFGFSTPYEAWDGGELTIAGLNMRVRPSGGSPDVNIKSGGVISVVLYSNANLDATQATNLGFGPSGTGIAHAAAHASDENADGLDDLVMHFRQRNSGLACGDTSVTLTGDTGDGYPFITSAPVNIVGC